MVYPELHRGEADLVLQDLGMGLGLPLGTVILGPLLE